MLHFHLVLCIAEVSLERYVKIWTIMKQKILQKRPVMWSFYVYLH